MKVINLFLIFGFCFGTAVSAQANGLLLDDFEGVISGGPDGTVDFGAGNSSTVAVTSAADIKYSGKQSLKIVYNAAAGGYMWIARGDGLDAKNTKWLVSPEVIAWKKYKAVSFYMFGNNSNSSLAFDLKDNGNEMWRLLIEDNFKGWKEIICPFDQFFARGDWQPDSADKNAAMDFPLKSYQFEPLPESKGALYFDEVKLIES